VNVYTVCVCVQSDDGGWKPGEAIPPRLDDLNLVQRERVLRYLVMRMAEVPFSPKKDKVLV
jgi:hypothetical protein